MQNKDCPKLLNCPFCGSTDIKLFAFNVAPECRIECNKCGASIPRAIYWKKHETVKAHDKRCYKKLAKLWNRRKLWKTIK